MRYLPQMLAMNPKKYPQLGSIIAIDFEEHIPVPTHPAAVQRILPQLKA